jgi:hypothetical protein
MRARNFGNIGIVAAMVISLVVVILGAKKMRNSSSGEQSIMTSTSTELGQIPTYAPTSRPSSMPSLVPTIVPSSSSAPSNQPSESPSTVPSSSPTLSSSPSSYPSSQPSLSAFPSANPSLAPSVSTMPSNSPTISPSASPSVSSAPSDFMGSNTTIVLGDGKSESTTMVAVGSIILIALAYAGMHLYKKENSTNDTKDRSADNISSGDNHHHSGFTTFFNEISNVFNKKDKRRSMNNSECRDPEFTSVGASQRESDDTIETNHLYGCTASNKALGRVDVELPNCSGILSNMIKEMSPLPPSPMLSDADSSKLQDIDLEDGRAAANNYFSSAFRCSGVSPLKSPKMPKRRQQQKVKSPENHKNKKQPKAKVIIPPSKLAHTRGHGPRVSIYSGTALHQERKVPSLVDDDISTSGGDQKKTHHLPKNRDRRLASDGSNSDESSTDDWDGDLASPLPPLHIEVADQKFNDLD